MAVDDTNLAGLDLEAAREYIFAFVVQAKRLDKDVAAAEAELALWRGRVDLASAKAMAELAAAAKAKAEEIQLKLGALAAERADIRSKVEAMRMQLPAIRARARSIDPDRLLAELQLMTGELLGDTAVGGESAAAVDRQFAELESGSKAEAELAALKRRAAGGTEPAGGPGTPGPESGGA